MVWKACPHVNMATLLFLGSALLLNNLVTIKHANDFNNDGTPAIIGLATISIILLVVVAILSVIVTKYKTNSSRVNVKKRTPIFTENDDNRKAQNEDIENGNVKSNADGQAQEEEARESLTANQSEDCATQEQDNQQGDAEMLTDESIGTQTEEKKSVTCRIQLLENIIVIALCACFVFNIVIIILEFSHPVLMNKMNEDISFGSTSTISMDTTTFIDATTISSMFTTDMQ